MNTERELKMFGATIESLEAALPPMVTNTQFAMMILSDAQEAVEREDKETARQFINRAKYFISKEI